MAEKLEIVLSATDKASGELKNVKGALSGLGDALGGALKFGAVAATAGFAALALGIGSSIQAAKEAEEGQAALGAVLQSTGGKAGVTAQMANDLAAGLQNVTRFSDDAVLSGENMLLTFTNIGKDVFPLATETMLDMSQALGQDVKSSAIQLGKALNDPINGVTALQRVGVSFTESQKEQIKAMVEAGDVMGAQKLILQELQTEFGGAARAAGSTFSGKLDILKNKLGDVQEQIGNAFLPALTQMVSGLVEILNKPEVQVAIASFVAALTEGLGQLGNFLQTQVFPVLGQIGQFVTTRVLPALVEFGAVVGPVLAGVFTSLQTTISNFVQFLTGGDIGNALGALMTSILRIFAGDEIANAAQAGLASLFNGIISAAQQLAGWLTNGLIPAIALMVEQISTAALPALQAFGNWLNTTGLPALQQLANFLGPIISAALAAIGNHITQTLIPSFTEWTVFLLSQGLPALGELAVVLGGKLNGLVKFLSDTWGTLNQLWQEGVTFIGDVKEILEEISKVLQEVVGPAFSWFVENVLAPFNEALAGLAAYISKLIEMLQKLAAMMSGGVPGAPNPPGVPGFERGGSFIVPPGYPRDSFLMGVSSGERVSVVPQGRVGTTGAGHTFVFNVQVRNQQDADYLARKVRALAAHGV